MSNLISLYEQLDMVVKYQKTHSSRDIATLLKYPHCNLVRVIKSIVRGRKTEYEYLLDSENVIRLIMALPEYNDSNVSRAKWHLTLLLYQSHRA